MGVKSIPNLFIFIGLESECVDGIEELGKYVVVGNDLLESFLRDSKTAPRIFLPNHAAHHLRNISTHFI